MEAGDTVSWWQPHQFPERSQIMREFIRGWRRKTGIVTLLLACVLGAAWIRSYDVFDFFEIGIENRPQCLGSFNGNLNWRSWNTTWGSSQLWQAIPADRTFSKELLNLKTDHALASEARQWAAPHHWIVIPLTLLSAFLLVSKPRPPKQATVQGSLKRKRPDRERHAPTRSSCRKI
jgi:hypothetical protein